MKANLKILGMAALFAWVSEGTHAGPVAPLTTFTAGTPAKASEVNGNFSAVSTAVNDNNSRITALESGAANPNITGNITLVPSTASAGNILKGTAPFIHNFGLNNTFIGVNAGNFTMTGGNNTASGVGALFFNTNGSSNTASGEGALQNNTDGSNNIAIGVHAGINLTTTDNNIDIGNEGVAGDANTIRIGTDLTQTAT